MRLNVGGIVVMIVAVAIAAYALNYFNIGGGIANIGKKTA